MAFGDITREVVLAALAELGLTDPAGTSPAESAFASLTEGLVVEARRRHDELSRS
jgi:hypothetical protein